MQFKQIRFIQFESKLRRVEKKNKKLNTVIFQTQTL